MSVNAENGNTKRRRVLRACDSCRLKKAKCDSPLACTNCTQRDIACIRRNGRKDVSKPHELMDMLVKAVHILHQARNVDSNTMDSDITTHAILERLGLIGHDPEPETELNPTNLEVIESPIASTKSLPNQVCTTSKVPLRSNSMTPSPHRAIGGSEGLPYPKSVGYIEGLESVLVEVPVTTPRFCHAMLRPGSVGGLGSFEPHHSILPLFRTELLDEMTLPSSIWTTNTASAVPSYNHDILSVFSGTPVYDAQVAGIGSSERSQLEVARETFGFDPVPPLPEYSLFETREIEINSWPDLAKHANYGSCGTLYADSEPCVSASALRDAYLQIGGDTSTTTTDLLLHTSAASPMFVNPNSRSEHSPAPSPSESRKCRPRSEETNELSDRDFLSTPRAQKRGHKRNKYNSLTKPHVSKNEKRRLSLEQNRHAASKCREKKRREVNQMIEASYDIAAGNEFLKQQTTRLGEETAKLRSELLVHMSHKGCERPSEIKSLLDQGAPQETRQTSEIKPTK